MNMLIVQKRLPYPPPCLADRAEAFLLEVQQVIREAEDRHSSRTLELADIGFTPAKEYIEVKLYFREPAFAGVER